MTQSDQRFASVFVTARDGLRLHVRSYGFRVAFLQWGYAIPKGDDVESGTEQADVFLERQTEGPSAFRPWLE
jgi:hypothetical protein